MILSAGLGTRLRPVTELFAKPAVPFLNIPLLYYPIALMEEAGIDSIVFNTHHKPEQIEEIAMRIPHSKCDVAFSFEAGAPLGSGGGIWKAKNLLKGGGDFLVSNGDEVILPREAGTMKRFVDQHRSEMNLATILVMPHPLVGIQFGGVWTDANGDVKGFGKDRTQFGPELTGYHYIGLLLLNDRVFEYLPDGESNILYDALKAAIDKGERVRVCVGSFTWFETGNPKDFLEATEGALTLYEQNTEDAKTLRTICSRFWNPGTRLISTSTGAKVLLDGEAQLDSKVQVEGFAVLGRGARVETAAEIDRCVVLPGARVSSSRKASHEIILPV